MIMQSSKLKLVQVAVLLSATFVLAGCQSGLWKKIKPPDLKVTGSSGVQINSSGDAREPAKINSSKTESVIAVPAGSTVQTVAATPTEPAKTVVTLSAASELRSVSVSDSIQTQKGNLPPSATETAVADGVRWSYYAAGFLCVAGFALIYFQHIKAGGMLLLAAVLAVPLTRFVSSDKAITVLCVIAAIGGTLYVAWYLKKGHPEIEDEIKQRLGLDK